MGPCLAYQPLGFNCLSCFNLLLVKLSTFQDLETRVAQLEQQIGTLFGTAGQNETDLTQVTSQINSIFAFVTNHAARLNAAGL